MSEGKLDPVEPERLAATGRVLEGRLRIGTLDRLTAQLAGPERERLAPEAWYRIACEQDGHGRLLISGEAQVSVPLECQRCLEPVPTTLSATFSRVIVDSEAEADQVPVDLDPLLRDRRLLDVAALIEEELMVSMPQVARHQQVEDCGPVARDSAMEPLTDDVVEAEEPEPTQKPFQVLSGLRGKNSRD